MNVSIIIPIKNLNKSLLKKVLTAIKKQKFGGKIEIIKVEKGLGLAEHINYGIKKAKYNIIVTLHQDCVPVSKEWLKKLIKPLQNPEVVASVSDVYDIETKKIYTPLLDEKGCAYKKDALFKVGLFDEKHFRTGGEDMDIYLKLKKIGKISYPRCIVKHYHPGYLINKSKYKIMQNANSFGCLFRIYWFNLPSWWKGLLLANPFNPYYFYAFWKGFLIKRQTI